MRTEQFHWSRLHFAGHLSRCLELILSEDFVRAAKVMPARRARLRTHFRVRRITSRDRQRGTGTRKKSANVDLRVEQRTKKGNELLLLDYKFKTYIQNMVYTSAVLYCTANTF